MNRKKKKLRFYNKKPETEFNKFMGEFFKLIMPKESVEKALKEASVFEKRVDGSGMLIPNPSVSVGLEDPKNGDVL